MNRLISSLKFVLNKKQKIYLLYLIFFSVFIAFFETISIGSLVGFIILISEPQTATDKIPIEFINDIILSLNLTELAIYSSALLILIFLIKNISLIFFYFLQERIVKNIYINLARKTFKTYLSLSYAFHINQNPSITINSINGETKRVTDFLVNLSIIFKEAITVIFLFILMLSANFKVASILVISMLIATVSFYKSIASYIKNVGIKVRKNAEKILQKLTEAISSIKMLKLIDKDEFFIQNVFKEMARKQNNEIIFRVVGKLPRLILEVLAVIIVVSILLYFVFEQNNITESIPTLSLVILIILRTLPACTNINTNLNNLRFNIKSVENIFKLLQQNKLNNLNIRHNNNNIVAKKIVLKNISFEYGEKKILNNVNYNFESGKIYGLKGESGSGKTTLIDLILGLLKPSSGQIYINDFDILKNNVTGKQYASYVPQDIYLTDNSIAENIAFGLNYNDINFMKLESILEKCNLMEFIKKLTLGYKTEVGDKGVKLSGGQKQRIGIARSFYNEKKFLILDEATSALDIEMENKIIKEIEKLKKDRIIILVAHRIKTLDICDEIITLSNRNLTKN